MISFANRFYDRIRTHLGRESDLPDFFIYHLTIERGHASATTECIRTCYRECDIAEPSWLAPHLSKGLKANQSGL